MMMFYKNARLTLPNKFPL